MSNAFPDERGRIIPQGDLQCVWMTAGVLSYQLCEREFECEKCPLDAAMRMHFGKPTVEPAASSGPVAGVRLAVDRRYSRAHCWVKRGGVAGSAATHHRIGLEPGLAAALPRPRSIVRPPAGEPLKAGHPFLWIVSEGGTMGLKAPLDGTVADVNADLGDRPWLLADAPLEGGWLVDLVADDLPRQRTQLMDARRAEASYAVDAARFRAELGRALKEQSVEVGPTLADGGMPLRDVSQMLGSARYFAVLCRVYG